MSMDLNKLRGILWLLPMLAVACSDGGGSSSEGKCGNGELEGHEECDDGNEENTDGCTNLCLLPVCGDGFQQPGEECDDGNRIAHDSCTNDCRAPRCGDGMVQEGEECDDANVDDTDYCLSSCKKASCGDGFVQVGVEACDDGNDVETDSCLNTCALASCGDGVTQSGEECDDGNNSNADGCLNRCLLATCGDGYLQRGEEECDDGNRDNNDSCLNDCVSATCGDGYLWVGVETCDDGNDDNTDSCRSNCVLSTCGDGKVQQGEECDDGNHINSDICLSTCQFARCGDGFIRTGVEECDDGNLLEQDGCNADCQLESCGDGIVHKGEQCDDGNGDNTDGCLNTCQVAYCGDNHVRAGIEQCDDGNRIDGDACTNACKFATCGDGIRHVGEELCDDGNDSNNDSCTVDCEPAQCGDGFVWIGEEACDDANFDNTDGCLINCTAFDFCEGFGITGLDTPVACETNVPSQLTLSASGLGFLVIDGQQPLVTFNGAPVTIVALGDCQTVPGFFGTAEGCAELTFDVPGFAGLPIGDYPIEVINPVTALCADSAVFSVGPPPTIKDVEPKEVCADVGFTLDITGTGFVASTVVTMISHKDASETAALSTEVSGNTIRATFGPMDPGNYDVKLSNGSGCEDVALSAVAVMPRPVIFFVDPPTVYNGIDLQATIFVANINGGGVQSVSIKRSGQSAWQQIAHDYDPTEPTKVQATVPANLVGDQEKFTYEVTLKDNLGCSASLNGEADLSRIVSMADFEVRPPFGGTSSDTAISITISDEASTASHFVEVPRVYLNPTGGGKAQAVKQIGYIGENELSALVSSGLDTGTYQVIVVNPDGTVGVSTPPIPGGFTVTSADPPLITTISPGSVPSVGTTVKVYGEAFSSSSVDLYCRDPELPDSAPTLVPANNVTMVSSNLLQFEMPIVSLNWICIVRVTNGDESFDEFSAVVQLNSAQNIPNSLDTGRAMKTARRGPVAVVGEVTRAARFLYAIGGDQGSPDSALSSVEVAPLTPYGDLGEWRYVPSDLPEKRALAAGVTIGKFIYLVGGHKGGGSGALQTVRRAEILRPQDAPQIDGELDIALDSAGIGPGLWYYRVSAVMDSNDADNPGGETLPSEALPIKIPAWAPDNFQITLRWSQVPGAQLYYVYRSPSAGSGLNDVRRIATIPVGDEQYTDTGATVTDHAPLQLGDLGEWQLIGTMNSTRSEFGVGLCTDPDEPLVKYLYALGGAGAGNSVLGDYEFLSITLDPATDSQTYSDDWIIGTDVFPPRRLHGVYTMDALVSTAIAENECWIIVGSGLNSSGKTGDGFESGQVQAGGMLTDWKPAGSSVNFAAYGYVSAANQVFTLGGDFNLNEKRNSGKFAAGGTITSIGASGQLAVGRELPGATVGNGRIFVLGGMIDDVTPTASVESSPW